MLEERAVFFGPFRLDVVDERVWQGQETLKLTRKAFAVLRYLVEHSGQLMTKEALFTVVWPEVVGGDAALAMCIRELRQVLGDEPQTPQYIETAYGRGYRFIAKVASSQHSVVRSPSFPAPSTQHLAPTLVGREAELAQLHRQLDRALSGERQLIFITGEPGIGKTTLVDVFVSGVRGPASEVTNSPESKVQSPESSKAKSRPLISDPQGEAEAYFLKAIDIARKQEAKSLELRATMSLVRLRQQQALGQGARSTEQRERSKESGVRSKEQEARIKLDEAHRMLSDVYNWFTEGFDTKDLREAKALLDSLI